MNQRPGEADDLLIERSLKGDHDAFNKLMTKHRDMVFNVSYRMLQNRDEAEDVVQQVFIEVFRHLIDFHHGAQFSTWLYSIALNRSRNHLRSRKSRMAVPLDPMVSDDESRPTIQIPDKADTPEQQLEKQSDMDWLKAKVKLLSDDYRPIVTMHYFQNMPLQAIADELGRPLATIKVYLHRARKVLMEQWQADKDRSDRASASF